MGKYASTPGVGSPLDIRFDEANVHYLHINRGVFDLKSTTPIRSSSKNLAPQPEQGVDNFSKDHTWITRRRINLR